MSKAGAARKVEESPSESPSVALTQPGRNGGVLNRGNPGNKGGGRPPDAIRALARRYGWKATPVIGRIALGRPVKQTVISRGKAVEVEVIPPLEDQRAAFAQIVDLGLGVDLKSEDVRKRLEAQNAIFAELLAPDVYAAVMARIGEVWS